MEDEHPLTVTRRSKAPIETVWGFAATVFWTGIVVVPIIWLAMAGYSRLLPVSDQ
jgi:hypothetical protein